MRTFNWLKRLRQSERGNALAIGAATLPLLLGSAAFTVDTIHFGLMKRQLQRAADSSALAGAYALTQGSDESVAVHNDLDENSFPALSEPENIFSGPSLGFEQTVRVRLTASRSMPFMSIFTNGPSTITGEATAALIQDGTFCVLSLYEGTDPGIDVGGNAELNLGCGMATNSRGEEAVTATGSSSVSATPIMAQGGLDGEGNNFTGDTTLQPYSARQTDPYADVPDPPAQSGCTPVSNAPGDPTLALTPGCYSSMDLKGDVTMAPGTYYVYGGDIEFGSQANVTGNGVTFVMTGPDGAAGDLKWNGQATVNLSAPTSGTYETLLFYRDRRASNIEIKINGGAAAQLKGALYFPSSDIEFTGNAGLSVTCLQLIGQILKFRGTSEINNSCPASANMPGFQATYVRLVS
jgi:Flp pilus assembly protein TadG